MQIRRYLYGNLNETVLKKYLNGAYKRLTFKGIMSFYPLIDDKNQLHELDYHSIVLQTLNHVLKRTFDILYLIRMIKRWRSYWIYNNLD